MPPPAFAPLPDSLADPEYAVALLLGADTASADELHLRSGRPAGEVLAALSSLEVLGRGRAPCRRPFRRL